MFHSLSRKYLNGSFSWQQKEILRLNVNKRHIKMQVIFMTKRENRNANLKEI